MKLSFFEKLWKTEDWWSVWIGLSIILIMAMVALWMETFIKGWAFLPGKLTDFSKLRADMDQEYLAISHHFSHSGHHLQSSENLETGNIFFCLKCPL